MMIECFPRLQSNGETLLNSQGALRVALLSVFPGSHVFPLRSVDHHPPPPLWLQHHVCHAALDATATSVMETITNPRLSSDFSFWAQPLAAHYLSLWQTIQVIKINMGLMHVSWLKRPRMVELQSDGTESEVIRERGFMLSSGRKFQSNCQTL